MQVGQNIIEELDIFRNACILGAVMVAGYDLLRLFRRFISHGIFWVSVEDFFYWMVFGVIIFMLLYRDNDGSMRGYILGGIVFGGLLYYLLIGRWFIRRISPHIRRIKKRLKNTTKAVTMRVRKHFKKRGVK